MTDVPGLADLIAPMALADFFDDVWGRSHYLARNGTPDRFAALLPDRRLEEVLAALRPHPDMLRLVKQGKTLPLVETLLPDGSVDLVQLRNHYADGYTIVLNGVERFVPDIRRLTNAIARDSDLETQVNVYVTPPAAQGFAAHFDDHDVLVLQVRGSKTWHVHLSSPLVPPEHFHLRERAVDPADIKEPERVTLSKGDVLYLPRGLIHAAETGTEASVHLTVGIHPPSLLNLLCASLEVRSLRGGRLLERVPPRYLSDPATRRSLVAAIRDLASLDEADIEHALVSFEDKLIKTGRCGVTGDFISGNSADIELETRVRRSAPMPARILPVGSSLGLQFAQSMVVTDLDHLEAFRFLCGQPGPFRVGDLPGLSSPAQLALAEKLLTDGFLTRAG